MHEALADVRDSKMLSPARRESTYASVMSVARSVGVGCAEVAEIDHLGIVPATQLAMQRALAQLRVAPEALILDALTLPKVALPQQAFPKADLLCLSVAAASIVAKVVRDRYMVASAETTYPGYGFAQHKGYGTPQHRDALDRLGVCPLHRRSFRPIAERLLRASAADEPRGAQ
jgi:ribonuclease HII